MKKGKNLTSMYIYSGWVIHSAPATGYFAEFMSMGKIKSTLEAGTISKIENKIDEHIKRWGW